MKSILLYAAIFGIPMLLYVVWLARFTRQLAFPLLLILAVVTVWGSLWPLHFGAEHWRVTGEMIGDQADADIAQVSIKISALMVQYEATAKTFADLSRLSLLDYL